MQRNDAPFASLCTSLTQKGYTPDTLASQEQIPELVDFIEGAFGSLDEGKEQYTANFRQNLLEGKLITHMIRQDGRIVGTASLQANGTIFAVCTDPAHRKQGIASTLVTALLEDGRRRGLPAVQLAAETEDAARLYRKLGFVQTGTIQVDGKTHPVMNCSLRSSRFQQAFNGVQQIALWALSQLVNVCRWLFSTLASLFGSKQASPRLSAIG